MRKAVVLAAVAGTALAVAVSALAGSAAPAQRVVVDMSEFKFVLKPRTARPGVVVFALANKGNIGHDFRIAGKKSAVLAAKRNGTLRVTFRKAGRYPFLCTLPSHAAAGMKGVLVVR
jgi:plastocyanin